MGDDYEVSIYDRSRIELQRDIDTACLKIDDLERQNKKLGTTVMQQAIDIAELRQKCANIARYFIWPVDSPMWGMEAERTAEAIAKAIEESA